MQRKPLFTKTVRSTLLSALVALSFSTAQAQWTFSGTNIYNTNSGNVGIGTTTPTSKLQVNGSANIRGSAFIRNMLTFDSDNGGSKGLDSSPSDRNITLFSNTGTSTLRGVSVNIISGEFGNINISGGDANDGNQGSNVTINSGIGDTPATSGNILMSTNGAGNVGIGTSSPLVKLQVEGGNIGQLSSGAFGAATGKWSALGQPPTAFPTGGSYYGLIDNWAQQNFITGLLDNGTKKDGIIAWQDQTSTSTTVGTSLKLGFIKGFGTTGANPAVFSEKMTILASGNVGIGTVAPAYRIELPNVANTTGQGRANAWVTYSSGRWKDNVKTIGKATEKILALRGVEYDWKKENGGTHAIGFVAEEVGKVLPEAVSWEADGKSAMGLNYDAVIPVLVEAFKELVKAKDTKIKSLEERVAAMEKSYATNGRAEVEKSLSSEKISAMLLQNRPNPFSENTIIEYTLPETTLKAALYIYDMQGKQLKSFDVSDKSKRSVEINGKELPAGMYLYSLVVDSDVIDTKRMLLTK